MPKLISFFMLFSMLAGIYGCESNRNDDIQMEEERPQDQAPTVTPKEGNAGPNR